MGSTTSAGSHRYDDKECTPLNEHPVGVDTILASATAVSIARESLSTAHAYPRRATLLSQ